MADLPYQCQDIDALHLALVVLQADETIERDFRRLLPEDVSLLVSRVPSDTQVTSDTLAAMAAHLTQAASLFPRGLHFDAAGYGCTSASAEIGADRIAALLHAGMDVGPVTNPLSALVAACQAQNITRLGFVSPYVAEVSDKLRGALDKAGIATPAFGSFEEGTEANVVRIDGASVRAAARTVSSRAPVDAIFLSCTNLRTLDVILPLQEELGMPVLSSNLVLAWDMLRRAGHLDASTAPSTLI